AMHFLSQLSRAIQPSRTQRGATVTVRRAVAIYVEAELDSVADAAALEHQAAALDSAERSVLEAGFRVLLRTGNAVLAARILPEPSPGSEVPRDGPLTTAPSIS